MEFLAVLLVAAAVFLLCFAVDKGFQKLCRSKHRHHSGRAVRFNRKSAAFGLVIMVPGIGAILSGITNGWLFFVGGGILILLGLFLVVQYMTFYIYYTDEGFALSAIGKKEKAYQFGDIKGQLLYRSYGDVLIELHMGDGSAVQLQSRMDGVYPFLDQAFDSWLEQTGQQRENCTFHDPGNSCWFPNMEE